MPKASKKSKPTVEIFDPPFRHCPQCKAFAICLLPPIFASKQTDGTNTVCHPEYGGCNQGYQLGGIR